MIYKRELTVTVRRLESENSFGIWFGEAREDGKFYWAKPLKLELDETTASWFLPEPSLKIPSYQMKTFVEQINESCSFQGLTVANNMEIQKSKNENLQDLRNIIEKLFVVLNEKT